MFVYLFFLMPAPTSFFRFELLAAEPIAEAEQVHQESPDALSLLKKKSVQPEGWWCTGCAVQEPTVLVSTKDMCSISSACRECKLQCSSQVHQHVQSRREPKNLLHCNNKRHSNWSQHQSCECSSVQRDNNDEVAKGVA